MDGTTDGDDKSSKLPAGEITDDVNSAVAPSVEGDKNSPNWNLPAKASKLRESSQKRKRPRRKSKKRKYPYARASWQQRREMRNSERDQLFSNGQPVAPYNTTQFLIEDHGDLQNIDAQLRVVKDQTLMPSGRPPRFRDSSFSVDSDDDYFYSSPEDEGEFLTKEFSNAYEDLHLERLSSMSKSEIIHDYLQLEAKYEKAVIELRRLKRTVAGADEEPDGSANDSQRDTDGSSKSENELAEQLRISQLENKSLKVELEELQQENKTLHNLVEKNQSSSVDSESDSSSTSSMSSDNSSCERGESDDDMNSSNNNNNNNNRTQDLIQTDSTMEIGGSNYPNLNGVNGDLTLSDDDEKSETDK